jgi:hypothetical protein
MKQFSNGEWTILVKRELQAEEWFSTMDQDYEEETVSAEAPLS